MWKSLAKISLERENAIHIAIRAHAAIGDFSKVSFRGICFFLVKVVNNRALANDPTVYVITLRLTY